MEQVFLAYTTVLNPPYEVTVPVQYRKAGTFLFVVSITTASSASWPPNIKITSGAVTLVANLAMATQNQAYFEVVSGTLDSSVVFDNVAATDFQNTGRVTLACYIDGATTIVKKSTIFVG